VVATLRARIEQLEAELATEQQRPIHVHHVCSSSLERVVRVRNAHSRKYHEKGFMQLADSLKSGEFVSRMHTYEDCVDRSLC
jgi:hypothetical protein